VLGGVARGKRDQALACKIPVRRRELHRDRHFAVSDDVQVFGMSGSNGIREPMLEVLDLRCARQCHYANAFVMRAIKSSASSSVRIKGGKN